MVGLHSAGLFSKLAQFPLTDNTIDDFRQTGAGGYGVYGVPRRGESAPMADIGHRRGRTIA